MSLKRFIVMGCLALLLPAIGEAQVAVSGRVTGENGRPLPAAAVFIPSLGIGTQAGDDGRYSFTVPAARLPGSPVLVTARAIGYKASSQNVSLAGATVNLNFALASNPLQLGEVVVTGAGTEMAAEKLGNVRNTVSADLIQKSNETNIVQALAGKAPNVEVSQTSGEPGASSFIRIRGVRTLTGTGQPLFVVDGIPVDNSSISTTSFNPTDEPSAEITGTAQSNRASDINPDDIESLEILKGAAAGAIYGARAGQGVVLITTKRGHSGGNRYSLRNTLSLDDINHTYALQTKWGQGVFGKSALPCDDPDKSSCLRSWGADITGQTVYDHATEAYVRGHTNEQTLSVSGGNDRTKFYLSGSNVNQRGIFAGPNNGYTRVTVRLNASHQLTDRLSVGGNFSYADSRGEFILRGNNVNGLQLGLLRTPPEFNNLPYLDPVTGLHRSYRMQHPQPDQAVAQRGFDNPFFVLNENPASAQVGRVFGNVKTDYNPLDWLKVHYTLGLDYSNDERLEGANLSSSDVSSGGRVTEGKVVTYQLDNSLNATATWSRSSNLGGTLTVGENLNSRDNRLLAVVGHQLVAPDPFRLSNTVVRDLPIDNQVVVHNDSYFAQGTLDLFQHLFLTAAARNDGSSTFSANHRRAWFPKGSAAFNVIRNENPMGPISFAKLRASYGEAGQEPDPYLTSTTYSSGLLSGISQGTGLTPTQSGIGGLTTSAVKGADELKPERTKEFETGVDLGFFRDKADLSVTFYNARTEDVILRTPLSPSTGYLLQAQNSGRLQNKGLEVTLNVRPIASKNLSWDVAFQWARNKSKVLAIGGADFIALDPGQLFTSVLKAGEEVGVFYDYGWVKCGITPDDVLPDLATSCAGKAKGAVYIGANGFPVGDPTQRVIGNPNPKWTGSVRSGLTLMNVKFSALLDIKKGGQIWNGTKSALYSYGTHKDTEQRATCTGNTTATCTGNEKVFGTGGWFDGPTAGPGVGKSVPIGFNWYRRGLAPCAFSGYNESCLEDGGYAKLRELSVAYTIENSGLIRSLGLRSLDLRLSGRNLKTWTNYTGYDPETNLGQGIERTRGVDYFNMPQTRSFVFSVGLNR